jgi:hypothetical protein
MHRPTYLPILLLLVIGALATALASPSTAAAAKCGHGHQPSCPTDSTPPDTAITSEPSDPSGGSVSFSFSGTDSTGVSGYDCQLDGSTWQSCSSPRSYTLASGSHAFQVRARDAAGNVDPTPAADSWSVQTSSTQPPPTSSPGGTVIFDDEFDGAAGSQPSSSRWSIFGGSTPPKWGDECFTNSPSNISQDGQGNLVLTARYSPNGVPCSNGSGPYTSGGMETNLSTLFHYQYGTAEARIKVPCQSGTGLWPAWWQDGTSWPTGGEIDSLEIMKDGRPTPGQGAQQTIHGPTTSGGSWQLNNNYANPQGTDWCNDYHVYGNVWKPGEIDFTVDGVVTRVLKPSNLQSGWSWPFDGNAERLFLDLQVGSWAGTVNNSTLPQSMLVDWVRVSQP